MKRSNITMVFAGLCLISTNAIAGGTDEQADCSHTIEVTDCFQTLAGDQKYILEQDLNCGCGSPALTVVGPAKLDLKGYTVSCSLCPDPDDPEDTPGIVVEGDKAVVKNGKVRDCRIGIQINDEDIGKGHRFVNLTLSNNVRSGLRSESNSSHNHFENIRAYDNGRRGIRIDGNHNKLIYNYAWANGNQGILIEGDHNKVDYNTAISNCRDGIEIKNGDKNKLVGNIAYGNGGNPGACPDASDAVFGINYRPWFYAGIDITKVEDEDGMVESRTNHILDSKANDNLGCWISPENVKTLSDNDLWQICINDPEFVAPDPDDPLLEEKLEKTVAKLRNRNLWDENADAELIEENNELKQVYKCNSDNKWKRNRSGDESNAKPECPCIEDVEGEEVDRNECKLAH